MDLSLPKKQPESTNISFQDAEAVTTCVTKIADTYGTAIVTGVEVDQKPIANGNTSSDDDMDGLKADEKLSVGDEYVDPDVVKAFNLFAKFFVDENLDRMVPISKQPKHKVRAIAEACMRQFPMFSESKVRYRLRTYLKACRRNGQRNGGTFIVELKPTPSHLTSPMSEKILAETLKNEEENARRLIAGLSPVSISALPFQLTTTVARRSPTPEHEDTCLDTDSNDAGVVENQPTQSMPSTAVGGGSQPLMSSSTWSLEKHIGIGATLKRSANKMSGNDDACIGELLRSTIERSSDGNPERLREIVNDMKRSADVLQQTAEYLEATLR